MVVAWVLLGVVVVGGAYGVAGPATGRARRAALLVALVAAFVLAFELARWAHDWHRPFWNVALVFAPIAAIVLGALWATRRFYGWPDLGPGPGRLAALAAALLVGTMTGLRRHEADVEASQAIADAWSFGPPEALARTRLGWFDPPPFTLRRAADGAVEAVAFPLDASARPAWRVRARTDDAWRTERPTP